MNLRAAIDRLINRNRKKDAGKSLPDSYVVIDIETTDFSKLDNHGKPNYNHIHIVEIGWCVVRNRLSCEQMAVQLKLPEEIDSEPGAFCTHGYSHETLNRIGSEPFRILRSFRELLMVEWQDLPVVGHNISLFDIPTIETNWRRYSIPYNNLFHRRDVFDTMTGYQAAMPALRQHIGEHGIEFSERVKQARRSSLDHLIRKYDVRSIRGKHRADEDAFLTHQIFEALREDGTLAQVSNCEDE